MAWDPFKDGGAIAEWDPFRDGGAIPDEPEKSYLRDKAARFARAAVENTGDAVAGLGSAAQSSKRLFGLAQEKFGRMVGADEQTLSNLRRMNAEADERSQADKELKATGGKIRRLGEYYEPDPRRDDELASKLAAGAGSLPPIIATAPLGAVTAATTAASMMGEQARQDAATKGATPNQQAATFALNAPVGALSEMLLGAPALLKSLPMQEGATALMRVAQQAIKGFAREGAQEAIEQLTQNVVAKDVVGFDPQRNRTEGVAESALIGGLIGAPVGAAFQGAQELDTGRNVPEARATLDAQQKQLIAGKRPAQMFPKGTEELPLPEGMERLETPRGVFHFNPAIIGAEAITAASAAGRENEVLALGSQSKADAEKRAAAGDPRVAVTERAPDGTEVKTAVATAGTAPRTAAELMASRTPGNTVQTESIGQVPAQRAATAAAQGTAPGGDFVADLLKLDAAKLKASREAAAREQLERAARQKELDAKKARFDETLQAARTLATSPDFPAVNGALESVRFYAEDNALGLAETQRDQARRATAVLEKRAANLKPAWEAAQEQQRQAAAATQAATDQAAAAARRTGKQEFKAEVAAGIGPDGKPDYPALPDDRLAELAAQGDKTAERTLLARAAAEGDNRPRLADVLRRRGGLPASSESLTGELRTLIEEGMTPQQRRDFVGKKPGELDRTAEMLREEGFSGVKTPADVIDLMQRMLRGEDVRADHANSAEDVSYAAAKRASPQTVVTEAALDKPVAIVTAPGKPLDQTVGTRTRNEDTTRDISIPRSALKKQRNHPSPDAVANTPELLRTMRHVGSDPDNAGRQNILAIHRFVGAVRRGANVVPVRVTVREMRGGEMVLHHAETLENEARPIGTSDVGPAESRQPSPLITERTLTVRELLQPVKGEDDAWRANFASPETAGQKMASRTPATLTDAEVAQEIAALRREFPALTRDLDLRAGLVEDELRKAGHRGPVPAGVRAAVKQLDAERRLLVIATRAARAGQAPGLFLHEMAHPFLDALPEETLTVLRELHAEEMANHTGPLFDAKGNLLTDLAVRPEDFPASRLAADPDLPLKEWFAERVRALNREWLAGRMPQDHTLIRRLWRELLAYVRKIFAQVRGLDPQSDLFTDTFRRWLDLGARGDLQAVGTAYAQKAQFAADKDSAGKPDPDKVIAGAARVPALPPFDRRAALIAELKRGRALATQGNTTGNDAALKEGTRLTRLARERLDDEYPGWEKPGDEENAKNGGKPPPPTPPEVAKAAQPDDQEPSAFRPEDEPTMPVRPGKFNEVYGQGSYEPTALARTWRKVRDVLVGIKGSVPELPTFPTATWNQADTFIKEKGATFYNRVKEGLRSLRSANDYVQRTAEEDVARITRPLIKAGADTFSADDYARLRNRQEQARRHKAEGEPVPAGVTAEIAALNSKMEASPYVLFQRLVLALDFKWRAENLKDSAGHPIALPGGVNLAEVNAELARLSPQLAASPHQALIQKAIEGHMALVQRVAADLKSRELLAGEQLANPYYFPHLTLETTRGGKTEQRVLTPEKVRPGTESDFRGYLIEPVGSTKAIETDYVRSMYYHLVQVGAHNTKADVVRDFFRPYDIKAEVEKRAKALSKERGTPVSWEQAFHEEYAPNGWVLYGADNQADTFQGITVDRDRLARRLGVMLTSDDLQQQFKELGLKGVKLLPEDLQDALLQGAKETWILPARVAEALRGISQREAKTDNAVESAAKWTLGKWKAWKLFMPWNHIRYEYGNVVADLEKMFSADPRAFRYLAPAAKELREFWKGGTAGADLQAALKNGVINAITAQEMGGLTRLKSFEEFQTRADKAWNAFKRRGSSALYQPLTTPLGLGDFSSPELSALREAVTRYAKFKADLEAIRANARPAYAGAYWREVEAITDSAPGANDAAVRKAAAISKGTFGDYGDLSVLGTTLRDKLIPFYSWMEINFRYHANLFRNLRDMVHAGEKSKAEAAKAGAQAAAVFAASFTARTAGGVMLRLALPYMAVYLWNNSGDRDELEKLLSEEDRRRFHLILGETPDGDTTLRDGRKVSVMYGNTAFMDVAKWVSGPKFVQAMAGWMNGKTDFPTAFSSWRDQVVPDFLNNTAGSFGPYFKIPYTLASKKNPFPDVLDQRTVPAYDMRRIILGQLTDDFTADAIERTVSKDYYGSKDLGAWAKQLILQVRQRDPEAWAFYEMKDKAATFVEKRTGQQRDSSFNAPDQQVLRNFRRAIYRGDVDKAVQFYQRLLEYGYTSDRFKSSIRAQDPLSALPKEGGLRREFVASLSDFDREQLTRAYEFYGRMSTTRGHESALFPSKASGERGLQRYQAQPRTDALRLMMDRAGNMTEQERERRAAQDEKRSLQRR